MNEYIAPEPNKMSFSCPHCNAFASQSWEVCYYYEYKSYQNSNATEYLSTEISFANCIACKRESIWLKGQMVYPDLSTAPLPSKDIPEMIVEDYLEARDILQKSPRGACALLRLALQKLCDELVEGKQNINDKIGILK